MSKKPWWKSKTKWAGVLTSASMIASMVFPQYAPVINKVAAVVLPTLGAFGVRDALESQPTAQQSPLKGTIQFE